MAIKLERDLRPSERDLWHRAKGASDAKNYDYVLSLLQTLLKSEPAFFEGRKLLRATGITKFKGVSSLARNMTDLKVSPMLMKVSSAVKKAPVEAMVLGEEVLALSPYNPKANSAVAEASIGLEMPEVAALCYETVKEGNPKDKANLHRLAEIYLKMGEAPKAITSYEQILTLDPRDGDALSGLKNAHAAHASKSGWEQAEQSGNFRKALANEGEASQLEQDAKVVKTDEALREQIARVNEQVQAEPTNPVHPKRIAQLYMQLEEYDSALEWYQFAYDTGGRTDTALEKILGDLALKVKQVLIRQYEDAVAADPSNEEYVANLDQLRGELSMLQLETARQRVAKYPNDGQYRFELGEAYINAGMYREALPELQLGLKQPNVRLKGLSLIGFAYWQRGMLDLAEKTYTGAAAEISGMDHVKKEIVYNLGLVYTARKQHDKAVNCFKQIYEVDMGFRDVAQRVEESYGAENGDQGKEEDRTDDPA